MFKKDVGIYENKLIIDGHIIEQNTYDPLLLYAFYSSAYAKCYSKYSGNPLYTITLPDGMNPRTMDNIVKLMKLFIKIYLKANKNHRDNFIFSLNTISQLFLKYIKSSQSTDDMEHEFNEVIEVLYDISIKMRKLWSMMILVLLQLILLSPTE